MQQLDLKQHPDYNGFDLSHKHLFSAKAGEILPVFAFEVDKGDKFKIKPRHFSRTNPVESAAYTRIREYMDFYYVPYNFLWDKFNTFDTRMTQNVQSATSLLTSYRVDDKHPYFTSYDLANYVYNTVNQQNILGFSRGETTCKLLQYLGYGDYTHWLTHSPADDDRFVSEVLSPFPLLAYQKVYQDHFRNTQWEKSQPFTWNINFAGSGQHLNIDSLLDGLHDNIFDLKYANFEKDLFMGLLPNQQFGEQSEISVSIPSSSVTAQSTSGTVFSDGDEYDISGDGQGTRYLDVFNGTILDEKIKFTLKSNKNTGLFSVIALRQAEFLQKWAEIAQSGEQDYKSQVEKFYGISVNPLLSLKSRYLGGYSSDLAINEVVNQSFTSESSSQPTIKGKGIGQGDGYIEVDNIDMRGIVIGIYRAQPLLDYLYTGIRKQNLRYNVSDYPSNSFDRIGMQPVRLGEMINGYDAQSAFTDYDPSIVIGYAPRYYEYKTAFDIASGAFADDSFANWTTAIRPADIASILATSYEHVDGSTDQPVNKYLLNYTFFKVRPQYLDTIFAVSADSSVKTDQFLVNAFFETDALRKYDYNGLPY